MATKVLDSWALMAFLQTNRLPGKSRSSCSIAAEDKHKLLLCVVNWGEIYYAIARAEGQGRRRAKGRRPRHAGHRTRCGER